MASTSRPGDRPAAHDVPVEPALGPALRDADEVLARAAADELAADRARERYLVEPPASLEPDAPIADLLDGDERVLAVRRAAQVDLRAVSPDSPPLVGGDLYLTSRRIVLVGRLMLAFDLDDIGEVILSGERLLVSMRRGDGLRLDVTQPRLLRVEIAAARSLTRQRPEGSGPPAPTAG